MSRMLIILARTIKDRRVSLVIYCVASILLVWMYVGLFPSMQQMADNFLQILEGYPDAFTSMFPINSASFASVENFMAIENYSLMVPVLLIFLLSGIAGASIAGQIENGTAELLLARPLSRSNIFLGKYFFGLIGLFLFVACSTMTVAPIAGMYNVNFSFQNYITMFVICFLFGWTVLSLAMLLSVLFSEKSRVSMVIGSVFILMYVIKIISTLSAKWEDIKYFSFFHYYNYEAAVINNTVSWLNAGVFIGLSVLFTLIALYRFNRRDIAV